MRLRLFDHIFKITVAAAGFFTIGLFGLIFGLIGGALLDQLLLNYRKHAGIRRFFTGRIAAEPGYFSIGPEERLASSAMAVIWYVCRDEPARAGIVSATAPELFPAVSGNIMELLRQQDETDFRAMASYFGSNASENEVEKLNDLIFACGLEAAVIRTIAGSMNEEAAEILSSAGLKMNRKTEGGCAEATEADYLILGVEPGTDTDDLRRIYHKLAADFHPDGGRELSPEQQKITEDAFKRIQAAYERLRRV